MTTVCKQNGYSSNSEAMKKCVMDGKSETEDSHLNQEVDDDDEGLPTTRVFINPFVHGIRFSALEKIQLVVGTVTLFPLRLILIGICLLFAWFFAYLAMIGRSKEDEKEPMTGWRRLLRPFAVFFARGLFFVGGFHWVTVKGKRASSAEAPILATAPHSSYMDALSVTFLGLTSVVAKTEAQDVPFFGTLTKFTQPVFVSREDPSSRQSTIREIQRRAATGGKWPQIIIFTEGTCTNRSCLINFKPGAFIPGVPVQPVCLKYKNKLDTVTWTWDGPGALKVLWLTLCQFNSNFEIEFLPVYTPNEDEKKDIKLFGRNVRAEMAKALGVPTSENSFEDGQAMMNAEQLCLPHAQDLVHINRIVRQLGVTQEDLKQRLPEVCSIVQSSASSSHFVKLEELARHLKSSPSSQPLQEFFSFYQKRGENVVDLRHCLTVLYLLSLPQCIDDFLRFSFDVYDHGRKGFLSTNELNQLLVNLDLPRSVIAQFRNSGDGPILNITYDLFKASAEKLEDYSSIFVKPDISDKQKKSSKSRSATEKTKKLD